MRLDDRVFVVTGGGSGIGREVVRELLHRGGRVAAVDVRAQALDETAALVHAGDRLSTHVADLTDRAAVGALPAAVTEAHGQVDGLLNIAGIIQRFVPFADLDEAHMEQVLAVNFWGVVHTTKAFLPLLAARPEACILNVSSMGGFVPVPGQTVYGASKAAVKLLTEGLYAEMRDTSIAVTVVFPGGVATDIAENSGASVPGLDPEADAPTSMTTPADAARQIVDAVASGRMRVLIGKDARMLDRLSRLAPRRAIDLVAKKMAALLEQ
jgi:short-subunit dehydrogenase